MSGLKYSGTKIATSFQPTGQAPFDVRSIVPTYSDISSSLNIFKNGGDDTSYIGMMVTTYDTGNVYILTSKSPVTWKEIGAEPDLSHLSGVFQFKGVAHAISPDNSYILLNTDVIEVTPIGTACDAIGNTYFGWQLDLQEIWTAGPFWENAVLYTKGDTSIPVYGLTISDTLYFVSDSQPKPTEGTLLESLDGRCVWLDAGSGSIEGSYTDSNPIGVYICNKEGKLTDDYVYGYTFKYDSYTFTESEEKANVNFYVTPLLASDGTKTDGDGKTIPNNSGHVYQIGENEYASNGTIWVKLGAPTENWIVL